MVNNNNNLILRNSICAEGLTEAIYLDKEKIDFFISFQKSVLFLLFLNNWKNRVQN